MSSSSIEIGQLRSEMNQLRGIIDALRLQRDQWKAKALTAESDLAMAVNARNATLAETRTATEEMAELSDNM